MSNSFLRSTKRTQLIGEDPFRSLPLNSLSKTKYQTPYKPSNTTNFTRNATMSLYSFTSKKKTSAMTKKSTIPLSRMKPSKSKPKAKSFSVPMSIFTQTRSKSNGGSKKKSNKVVAGTGKERVISASVIDNLSFYRANNLDGEKKMQIMHKLSKIFDLVQLNISLPSEIQKLLNAPIRKLRENLRKSTSIELAHKLLQFKNECSDILKQSSHADVCQFLRIELPENSRWSMTNHASARRKQFQRSMRQNYFSSLVPKRPCEQDSSFQQLKAIQNRLDAYLQNSLKNRRVYI